MFMRSTKGMYRRNMNLAASAGLKNFLDSLCWRSHGRSPFLDEETQESTQRWRVHTLFWLNLAWRLCLRIYLLPFPIPCQQIVLSYWYSIVWPKCLFHLIGIIILNYIIMQCFKNKQNVSHLILRPSYKDDNLRKWMCVHICMYTHTGTDKLLWA